MYFPLTCSICFQYERLLGKHEIASRKHPFSFQVSCDLKVIALLLKIAAGVYKILLLFITTQGKTGQSVNASFLEKMCYIHPLFVEHTRVLLPQLHIKVSDKKNTQSHGSQRFLGFMNLKGMFPKSTVAKIKEGSFLRHEIRHLFKDNVVQEGK